MPTEGAMKLKHRFGLFAGGGVMLLYGFEVWQRYGVFPYRGLHYFQPVFPVGVIVVGLLVAILAFLPSGNWVYRRIGQKRDPQPHALEMTLHPTNPKKHEPN